MKLFGRELTGIPKALVVLVTILLIASGLCGITASIESHNHWYWFGPVWPDTFLAHTLTVVDFVSYAAFMISGLLTPILLVVWPFLILMNWLYGRSGKSQANKLQSFMNKDEDGPNEPK